MVTQQAISHYENVTRVLDDVIWHSISKKLKVRVEYLKGEIEDPEGWDLWSKESGYTVEEIKDEIKRMKSVNHAGFLDNYQDLIYQAVKNLNGIGNTDKGIIEQVYKSIQDIKYSLPEYYSDNSKEASISDEEYINLYEVSDIHEISERIYDDLDPSIFIEINTILNNALSELKDISDKL